MAAEVMHKVTNLMTGEVFYTPAVGIHHAIERIANREYAGSGHWLQIQPRDYVTERYKGPPLEYWHAVLDPMHPERVVPYHGIPVSEEEARAAVQPDPA